MIAAIIIATSTTFFACKLFSSKDKQTFVITGKWNIDSAYTAHVDTSNIFQQIAASGLKNMKGQFSFSPDSLAQFQMGKDTSTTKYYYKDSSLFIKEDTAFTKFTVHIKNDSSIALISPDSIFFILKKKAS